MAIRQLGLFAATCTLLWCGSASAAVTVVASGHVAGGCLDVGGSGAVLARCSGSASQQLAFRSGSYGAILVGGQQCLSTSGGSGSALRAVACANVPEQRWINASNGQLRNELGWCADVSGGGGIGSRVIAYACKGGASELLTGSNQRWGFSRFVPAAELQNRTAGLREGSLVSKASLGSVAGVVSAGGGNVVSAGGANVVAAGGANVVSAGGGNLIVPVSGVVAAGGMN